jgi:hypothetical protein
MSPQASDGGGTSEGESVRVARDKLRPEAEGAEYLTTPGEWRSVFRKVSDELAAETSARS